MRELAVGRMTVDEFLDWEDGTDTRYELVDGQPVAMASGTPEHGELIARLSRLVGNRLHEPCRVVNATALRSAERVWHSYIPDVVVTCQPRQKGQKAIEATRLIVEVLSPSTASNDHGDKFYFYRAIPTVEEILFVASTTQRIEAWRRVDGEWHAQLLGKGAMLNLAVGDTPIPLDEIYGNVLN